MYFNSIYTFFYIIPNYKLQVRDFRMLCLFMLVFFIKQHVFFVGKKIMLRSNYGTCALCIAPVAKHGHTSSWRKSF